MNEQDIQNMSISEIVNLPRFRKLEREEFGSEVAPHWKITFESDRRTEKGTWKWFDREGPFKFFIYYKIID